MRGEKIEAMLKELAELEKVNFYPLAHHQEVPSKWAAIQ